MIRERYRSGPFVWLAIIAATCLLLFLFQKILWLVVPFLLALIGYYLLYPLQQRLVLGGMSRDSSAVLVSCGAFAVAGGIVVLVFPWVSAHLVSWQGSARALHCRRTAFHCRNAGLGREQLQLCRQARI